MQWQHEWIASLTWIARTYSMACQRFGLLGLDLDATFLIGTHPQYGAYMAGNIQVTPGNPLTIAVSRLSPTVVPAEHGGVVVFDDVTPRPVSAPAGGFYSDSTISCGAMTGRQSTRPVSYVLS